MTHVDGGSECSASNQIVATSTFHGQASKHGHEGSKSDLGLTEGSLLATPLDILRCGPYFGIEVGMPCTRYANKRYRRPSHRQLLVAFPTLEPK